MKTNSARTLMIHKLVVAMTIFSVGRGVLTNAQLVFAVGHRSSSTPDRHSSTIDPSANGSFVHPLTDTIVQSTLGKPNALRGTWITTSHVTEVGTLNSGTKYTAAVKAKLDVSQQGGSLRGVLQVDKRYTTAHGTFARSYQVVIDLTDRPREPLQWISGKVTSAEVRGERGNPHALPYKSMDVAVLFMSAKRLTLSVNLHPGMPRRYQYDLWKE